MILVDAGQETWYFCHTDGLGSVAALSQWNTAASQVQIVERYRYDDVFGRTTVCDGNGTPRENIRMIYMKKNGTSDFIGIVLYGKNLNADEITKCIGLEPTNCGCKGDQGASGKKARTGYWVYYVRSKLDIHEQFSLLTENFRHKEQELREILSWKTIETAFVELVLHPPKGFGTHGIQLKAKEVEFWCSIGFDLGCEFWTPYL